MFAMSDEHPTDWRKFAKRLGSDDPADVEWRERVTRGEVEIPEIPPPSNRGPRVASLALTLAGGSVAAQIGASHDLGLAVWPLLAILCMTMVAVGILWERYQ
jgi:hypothetical protein